MIFNAQVKKKKMKGKWETKLNSLCKNPKNEWKIVI